MPSRRARSGVSPAFKGYLEAQQTAEQLHGDRTIVMMQMGSFLEMFHVKFTDGTELGRADELNDVLSKMGEKKDQVGKVHLGKEIKSVSRYGFPYIPESKERFVSIANKRGYTVPVYYQKGNEKDPITKIVPRYLGDTWTPTVRPEGASQSVSNEWFVGYLITGGNQVGVCAINPHTRSFKTTRLPHACSGTEYIPESSDFLRMNSPTEVIMWVKGGALEIPKLGIPEDVPIRMIRIPNTGPDTSVCTSVMNLVSSEYVLCSDIPEVVVRSFDFMMSTIPDVMIDTQYHQIHTQDTTSMRLENHCLSQLNIIEPFRKTNVRKRKRSVIGIVNHTYTNMGDRTIREWITNPSTKLSVITTRTLLGEHLVKSSLCWGDCLKDMADLDRLFSSEVLGGLSYKLLMDSTITISRFIRYHKKEPLCDTFPIPTEEATGFLERIREDLVDPSTLPYGGSVVGGGVLSSYSEPCEIEFPFTQSLAITIGSGSGSGGGGGGGGDSLWDLYREYKSVIDVLKKLQGGMGLELGYVNNSYVLWVKGGKKAVVKSQGGFWKDAKKNESKNAKGRYELDTETRVFYSGEWKVLKDVILCANILRTSVNEKTRNAWLKWSKDLRKEYEGFISRMSRLIGEVDAALSGVKCVQTYGYSYANVTNEKSYYKAEGLRHPLIESIQQDVPYVPHSIRITEGKRGRLLFGVNSSGKSSLMKAIGVSIVLAQAGLPVPVRKLDLGIYHSLFTRILGNDDLFQGMSTFAVESSELLRILKTSTERSMVLGDELCSGTEQYGAEAIVAASILILLKRNVSCVFATHWHRLRDLPDLRSHPSLVWNHLRVDCNEEGKMIMYRTLEDGPGPRGYAIEYLKNMGADSEMIREAENIRSRITSEEFAVQSARSWNKDGGNTSWNSMARVNSICEVCKKQASDETDHIIPREIANSVGGIDGLGSVHHGGNLVGLCKDCHSKKTRGLIHIDGFQEIMGSNGIREKRLMWEYAKNNVMEDTRLPKKKSRVEDEEDFVDPVKELIIRFSSSGSSVRQIQGAMKRNGYRVSQSFIRETLKT